MLKWSENVKGFELQDAWLDKVLGLSKDFYWGDLFGAENFEVVESVRWGNGEELKLLEPL